MLGSTTARSRSRRSGGRPTRGTPNASPDATPTGEIVDVRSETVGVPNAPLDGIPLGEIETAPTETDGVPKAPVDAIPDGET